jgi:hypothetical protein
MATTRWHLFEFEDLEWFPSRFRHLLTELLRHQTTRFGTYIDMGTKLHELVEKTGAHQIIDLCSGSGGPMLDLLELLRNKGFHGNLLLTDKFPDPAARQRISDRKDPRLRYLEQSVDATNVPAELAGVRTMFTAFHHFRPDEALRVLRNAVAHRDPIAIFEFTERSRFMLLKSVFPLVAAYLGALTIRPLRLERVMFTFVLPIVPLTFYWDALVSNFRTYTEEELREMVRQIDAPHYRWEVGKQKASKPIFNITYLIGYPEQAARENRT